MFVTSALKRAAQYVRMSTEMQQYSTANQKAVIASWAETRGIEIVATYEDTARSGLTLAGRPALRQAIADVLHGSCGFDAILVYDVSRWGRFQDADESAHLEYLCRAAGVGVHYCAEPFSNDGTPLANFCKVMKRALAAEYSRELSDKVSAGKARLAVLGFHQGSRPGYGLRRRLLDQNGKDKGALAVGEQKRLTTDRVVLAPGPRKEIATVRWIYEAYADLGLSVNAIRNALNERGLMYEGRPWSRGAVNWLLTSPKYVGENIWGMSTGKLLQPRQKKPYNEWFRCEGAFKPIVPRSLFDRVRKKREELSKKVSNETLLDQMQKLARRKGRISSTLLRKSGLAPSLYYARFGSLAKAYELCGLDPPARSRDIARMRAKRAQRRELQNELRNIIETAGGTFAWRERRGEALINEELSISFLVAAHEVMRGREVCAIQCRRLHVDIIIFALLNPGSTHRSYFILPPGKGRYGFKFRNHNERPIELFRLSDLGILSQIAQRAPLGARALQTIDEADDADPYNVGRPPALISPRDLAWKWRRNGKRYRARTLLHDVGAYFERKRRLIRKATSTRALARRLVVAIRSYLRAPKLVASLRTAGLRSAPVALFESFPAFCATGEICAARDHPSPVAGTRNADGLCRETTALLSGLKLKPNTILALARLKDTRQVEVAREMREECRCSYQFARTLVAITPTDQLLRPHLRHVIAGRRGMYEAITREAIKIDQVYKAAQAEYPADAFALVALSAFARRLVDTEKFAPARKIAGARRLRELERVLADYAAWRAWKPSAPFGGDHAPS